MKLLKHPYHLILFLSASVVMVFFLKIDKHGFYTHYFKEIAEIELRNSQEMSDATPELSLFSISVRAKSRISKLFRDWLSISIPTTSWLSEAQFSQNYAPEDLPLLASLAYSNIHPTRAP